MAEDETNVLVCDVCFNDQLIVDVNLAKTCGLAKIVQGLWDDGKFRSAALSFLKNKEEEINVIEKTPVSKCSLKSFHNLDRSILRAYVAVRIMPNWKWLELKDFIADFENRKESLTVADVFGNFCSKVHKPILRIVPKRETEADDQEVKTIIQELLQTKSLATLSATGCPLSKGMLSLIGQDKYMCTISYDKREKFVHWLRRQDFTQEMLASPEKSPECSLQTMTPFKIAKSRVTFDPEDELLKLMNWFDVNQRPGKELIEEYTRELNKGRFSRSKRMLTQESIAVWFKNRRSKAKKEENGILEPWEKEEQNIQTTATMATESKVNKENIKGDGVDSNRPPVTTETGVDWQLGHNGIVKHKFEITGNMVDNEKDHLLSPSMVALANKSGSIGGERLSPEPENEGDDKANKRTGEKDYTCMPVAVETVKVKSANEDQCTENHHLISVNSPNMVVEENGTTTVQATDEKTSSVQEIGNKTPNIQEIGAQTVALQTTCSDQNVEICHGQYDGDQKKITDNMETGKECDETTICSRNNTGTMKRTREDIKQGPHHKNIPSTLADSDIENRKRQCTVLKYRMCKDK